MTQGSKEQGQAVPEPPSWVAATVDDVSRVDFEKPISAAIPTDTQSLWLQYRAAAQTAEAGSSERRIFDMLSGVTQMHFKPREQNEPFGPMLVYRDRRSAVPSDFRGQVELLALMAERAKNPVLRARLADVSWLLDRKRAVLASIAIDSYLDIVKGIDCGSVKSELDGSFGVLGHDVQDYLRRALQIGRSIGWDKPQVLAVRDLAIDLRKRAFAAKRGTGIYWFSYLDLDFQLSAPDSVAADLEQHIRSQPGDASVDSTVALWRLAATGYHYTKRNEDKNRCQSEAAECYVTEAAARSHSPMLAAHFLSNAIAQLSGVAGKKERRTALRHRLVDIQSHVAEEMPVYSAPLDLKELAEATQKDIGARSLLDKLLVFACLHRSPDPDNLVTEARKSIKEHPLASLFGTAYLDRDGKVIHRSEALGVDQEEGAIRQQIAQAEKIRRTIEVGGLIEPARQAIIQEHDISDDILAVLFQHSPFVPPDLFATFARGFARFFQGDFVGAVYILTPLLENSLRYALKLNGHDVSVFGDVTQTQQDRTLSTLYEQMRGELDAVFTKALATDINNVFSARPGPALRHSLAHGLLHDDDPYGHDAIYACHLIFRLCVLPLLSCHDRITLPA